METPIEIHLTDAACQRIRQLLESEQKQALYLSVKAAGCSGLEYVMACIDEPHPGDLTLQTCDVTLYIDADAYRQALKGLTIDFQQDLLSSGFIYHNPNQKGACGCGQSFSV